jgi:hypothetical protein
VNASQRNPTTRRCVALARRVRLETTALLLTVGLGLGWLAPIAAEAQGRPVRAEVLIVLAKEEAGSVDAELAEIPALRRPPFNAFRTMRVLSRPRFELTAGHDTDVRLPNGRRLRIQLQRVMPDGRYQMRVSINRPDENDYLPLLQVVAAPGDPFFVAGQGHEGGTLVIGIRVGV